MPKNSLVGITATGHLSAREIVFLRVGGILLFSVSKPERKREHLASCAACQELEKSDEVQADLRSYGYAVGMADEVEREREFDEDDD